MFVVCHSTFAWSSLRLVGRIPLIDAVVLALVSVVVVVKDLAVAVVVGTVLSALSFAWTQSRRVSLDTAPLAPGATTQEYVVDGILFFGSARHFVQLFTEQPAPDAQSTCVVLDFLHARILDLSAVEAIGAVASRFGAAGKQVVLRHLPAELAAILQRDAASERPYLRIEQDTQTDPVYGSAAVA